MNNKLKYLIIILFIFFGFNLKVHAYNSYINFDTDFIVNSFFDYSTLLNNSKCGDETYYQFINEFISSLDFQNSRYHLFITFNHYNNPNNNNKGYFHFYAIPKSYFNNEKFSLSFSRNTYNPNGYLGQFNNIQLSGSNVQYFEMTLAYLYSIDYDFCSNTQYNSFLDSNVVSTFISYFNNSNWQQGIYISEQYLINSFFSTSFYTFNNVYFDESAQLSNVPYTNSSNTLNSNSVDIEGFYLPFFSSYPLTFSNSNTFNFNSNENVFMKNIYFTFNQTRYSPGDIFPTYYDLIMNPTNDTESFVDYQTRLGTIYGSFEPSQLSNYYINVKFDTDIDSLDYYNNLGYTWNCYGRINNNGYYSYEQFPYCDFERNSNYSNGIDFDYSNFMVYDSNDNPITNLSRYDKIFVYINHQYKNDSLNKVLHNLSISSNHFVIYNDTFNGPIYETFDNLSDHFRMFLTTSKSTYSYIMGKYSIDYDTSFFNIRQQSYDITNFQGSINPGWIASNFNRYSVNNSSNTGLMIFYMYYQYDEPLNYPFTLHLVFFPDIVISLNETASSDTFYYYDNTGTIISSNITIDYDFNTYDNYDLSYYLKQVSSFIDDLSESAYTFSIYTQAFYDNLPLSFQTFVFVIFILGCTYFIYLLIKRK